MWEKILHFPAFFLAPQPEVGVTESDQLVTLREPRPLVLAPSPSSSEGLTQRSAAQGYSGGFTESDQLTTRLRLGLVIPFSLI